MATEQELKNDDSIDSQDERNDSSCHKLPLRFIRLHPRVSVKETLSILQTDDGVPWIRPVPWFLSSFTDAITQPPFYAIPGDISLQQTSAYQLGRIYGQDVSSGCSVAVLLEDLHHTNHTFRSDLRILDLCACPGLKLCAIADYLHHYYQQSCSAHHHRQVTLIGVDVDADRLRVCKRILQKYQTPPVSPNLRIQLYCGDGTTFLSGHSSDNDQQQHVLVYDSHIAQQVLPHAGQKRINKSGRRREQLLLQSIQQEEEAQQRQQRGSLRLFDYVLVDAECSTDGSLGQAMMRSGSTIAAAPPPTPPALIDLQRRLLQRGLDLLRPGCGRLVYATCSLRDEQNDGVVEHVLTTTATKTAAAVRIVPVHPYNGAPAHWVRQGRLPGTVQLWPNTTDPDSLCGSGLYIAKLRKGESTGGER